MDDERLAGLDRECSLLTEKNCLALVRRVVAEVVEPGLADPDRLGVVEELRQSGHLLVAGRPCVVWMDAEHGEHPLLRLGQLENAPTRVEAGADRDHPRDAGLAGPRERRARVVERVEVRVGVDHAAGAADSTRGNSGSAARIPSAAVQRP